MSMRTPDQSPKNQHIHCSVKSCSYNTQGNECGLQAIQVSPTPNGSTGRPEDESACASYEVR